MTIAQLEKRLAALESKVESLNQKASASKAEIPWWKLIQGSFAGDADHEAAMKLGREYRESLRPKSGRRRNGRS
ncbi:MAG: hypothetical protein EXS05_01100 [Planctomycetaceae bacterium]|nr:hypothetical protein [Planctomycetaceae bacterium]